MSQADLIVGHAHTRGPIYRADLQPGHPPGLPIEGLIVGHFGIHPSGMGWERYGPWQITIQPGGYAVGVYATEQAAEQIAEELEALPIDWDAELATLTAA